MITKTANEFIKESLSKKEFKKKRHAERSVTQKKQVPQPSSSTSTQVATTQVPQPSSSPSTKVVNPQVAGSKNVRMLTPKALGVLGATAAVGYGGHQLYKKYKNPKAQ